MAERTSPTFRRRRLARRLRWMREQARMTLEDAAPRLDKTKSALSRIETGMAKADVHLVRSMMDVYDHYDPELLDLAREAARPGWWAQYNVGDRGFIGMETEASAVREFTLVHVPGLLQTEGYMRALYSVDPSRTDAQVEIDVSVRRIRQERLTDGEFPLELTAIIDESALRKTIGAAEVMRGQLRHLIDRADLPTVSVQVLPNDAGLHVGMDGAFTIVDFPEDDPDLLYIEHATGALHIEKPEDVATARLLFDQLRSAALSPRDSAAFLERLADDL